MTWEERSAVLEQFNGTARLFPLPNLVLFPHVEQGLHIFEDRYRQMAADALEGDRLIAMVLLKPDWEFDYDSQPAIEAVGCLGLIQECELLPDGRYNLLLHGVCRIKIDSELPLLDGQLYRTGVGTLVEDTPCKNVLAEVELRSGFRNTVEQKYRNSATALERLRQLFESPLSLGQLADQLAYLLPLPLELKQRLLVEHSPALRVALIQSHLHTPRRAQFPPPFSQN